MVPTLGRNLAWLKKTLESVSSQSVDVDLVVVAPNSAPIADLVRDMGGRCLEERGRSLSEALNQGFEIDKADSKYAAIKYFAWIGDDDLLAPRSLEKTVTALEARPDAALVLGRVRYITAEGATKWVLRSGAWASWYARLGQNFMSQPGSLMRRSHFEAVGGLDTELKNSMDQDLFLRLAQTGAVVYVPFEVAAFRVHHGSISSNKGEQDERRLVTESFRPSIPWWLDKPLRLVTRLSDRVLLSAHSRIPHRAALESDDGRPYHMF